MSERYTDDGEPWRPLRVPLSRFLVFVEVMEAVMDPRFGALNLSMAPGRAELVTAGTRVLDDPMWRIVGGDGFSAVRAGPDTLVLLLPGDSAETTGVYLAARTEEILARYDALAWDWRSADDQ